MFGIYFSKNQNKGRALSYFGKGSNGNIYCIMNARRTEDKKYNYAVKRKGKVKHQSCHGRKKAF